MIDIRSYTDCKIAISILRDERFAEHSKSETIIDLKRAVRKFLNRKPRERRCIYEDGYGSYVLLYPLPDNLKSIDDAEEYFEEFERLECEPSMYDCTGQHFTTGHKIFYRHGRIYVFHSISIDC